MFNKMKIKLTLFNIAVIGSILIIISLVIFFNSPNVSAKRMNQEMWMAAIEGNASKGSSELFKGSNIYKDYTYVRVDLKGQIIESSPTSISSNDLDLLVQRAFENNYYSGEIKLSEDNSYLFMKASVGNENAVTLVFTKSIKKSQIIVSYIIRTILFIIFVLILVFLGSLLISGKALVPIKKAWQRQIDFAADASHELRTPLAVMQTNLELVLGNSDETVESQKDWLENALVESKRMAKIVDDLLTLSRADAQHQTLQLRRFMLDKVLKEVAVSFEPVVINHNITLSTDIQSEIEFLGDSDRIKQLFIILIDNALKYSNIEGKVSVQLRQIDKFIEITVSDTGEGIEKEHLEKIFDRFYRVDKSRSRNEGGSGLGLAIAKWIVDEHKGKIKADSILGKGTKFTVLLPFN